LIDANGRVWDSSFLWFGVALDMFEDTPINANYDFLLLLQTAILCHYIPKPCPSLTTATYIAILSQASRQHPQSRLASPRLAMGQARGK